MAKNDKKEYYNFQLPVGRMISGSVKELRTTDHQGQPLAEDAYHWYIGLAVEKSNPKVIEIIHNLFGLAQRGYARDAGAMALIGLGLGPFGPGQKGFSWKVKDGDERNPDGTLKNEHGAGCFIFHLSNNFPIKVGNAQNVEIDPKTVERGYFVDASVSACVNEQTGDRAGIYLNLQAVRLIAYGEIIQGGQSLGQMFGDAPAQYAALPPGASAMPIAAPSMGGAPVPMQQPQPAPQMMPQQQMQPAPVGMPLPGAVPQMQPAPAPQMMPQQQPQMMQPAPVAGMPLPGAVPQQAQYLQPGNVHAAAMPLPGAPVAQQQPNMPSATGYPSNVQPHTQFLQGPQG